MAVKEITRQEFDSYNPVRRGLAGTVIVERAWFALDDGPGIGAVTFDKSDSDWGFIVLEPGTGDQYTATDVEVSMASFDEAKSALLARLSSQTE